MSKGIGIEDKTTEQLRGLVAELPGMSESELWDAQTGAAEDFAAYALHPKLPRERQGSTDSFAQALRAQRRDAAEALWLAVQAELAERR